MSKDNLRSCLATKKKAEHRAEVNAPDCRNDDPAVQNGRAGKRVRGSFTTRQKESQATRGKGGLMRQGSVGRGGGCTVATQGVKGGFTI